jgi:hypothetical protein
MEQIRLKIQELLDASKEDTLGNNKGWEALSIKMKKQEALMDELKELAKAQKTLLGRTLRFPMADSYALYLITSVGKKDVQLKWLDYCDGWVDDRCGYACRMSLSYANGNVKGEDALDELFSGKKVTNV